MGDNLVKILIEKLLDADKRILVHELGNLISLKEISDPVRFEFAEFLNETILEVWQLNELVARCTMQSSCDRLSIEWYELLLQTVNVLELLLIHFESADDLVDAVGHVELIQIASVFRQVSLIKWRLVELVLLRHLHELQPEQIFDRAPLQRVDLQRGEREFLQLLRHVQPDRFFEVEELLVPLVSYSAGHEKVDDDADGPNVALGAELVLADFWGEKDPVDTGDEIGAALVQRLREDHSRNVRQLYLDVVAAFKAVFDKDGLRRDLVEVEALSVQLLGLEQ